MRIRIEWKDLPQEKKEEIVRDLDGERAKANRWLRDTVEKFRKDRGWKFRIVRFFAKNLPGWEALETLANFFPLDYRVLKQDPFTIEIVVEDWYFKLVKQLPGGGLISRLFSPQKFAEDVKRRAEYYGELSKFEVV